jgi:hypothetical protein
MDANVTRKPLAQMMFLFVKKTFCFAAKRIPRGMCFLVISEDVIPQSLIKELTEVNGHSYLLALLTLLSFDKHAPFVG